MHWTPTAFLGPTKDGEIGAVGKPEARPDASTAPYDSSFGQFPRLTANHPRPPRLDARYSRTVTSAGQTAIEQCCTDCEQLDGVLYKVHPADKDREVLGEPPFEDRPLQRHLLLRPGLELDQKGVLGVPESALGPKQRGHGIRQPEVLLPGNWCHGQERSQQQNAKVFRSVAGSVISEPLAHAASGFRSCGSGLSLSKRMSLLPTMPSLTLSKFGRRDEIISTSRRVPSAQWLPKNRIDPTTPKHPPGLSLAG